MASSADQVRRLARALSDMSGVTVAAEYDAPRRRDGTRNGWSLSWTAGPTRSEMRQLAATHLSRKAYNAPLDAVTWRRGLGTDEQAAAALLAWMTDHPTDAELALHLDEDALPGSPDQLPAVVRRRAATLVTAGWRLHTAGPADAELRDRATRGWPDVASWLDEIGAAQDANVVPLRRLE